MILPAITEIASLARRDLDRRRVVSATKAMTALEVAFHMRTVTWPATLFALTKQLDQDGIGGVTTDQVVDYFHDRAVNPST